MWRKLMAFILVAGAVGYAGLCLLVYNVQSSLLLFPSREVQGKPAPPFEELSLKTAAGETLHGWAVRPPQPGGPWVLHCHGNGGNIGHRLGMIELFRQCGVGAVVFDYRGYGQSTGAARSEADLLADAEAAWQWVHAQGGSVVIYGESLGGGVAAALAERHPPQALILQSTFTSVPDRAAESYPFLPVRWLSRFRLDTLARIGKMPFPKLIMHGPADEVIPYAHGRKLYEAAAEPKEFGELSGGHNGPSPELGPAVQAFLARHANR